MIDLIDKDAKTVVGKSLAGLQLGESIETFLPYIDTAIDGNEVPWSISVMNDNPGVTPYKIKNNQGYKIHINRQEIELLFSPKGFLRHIEVNEGYADKTVYDGEIFEGLKIGDKLADIKHPTYHCDPDEVHYLVDDDGEIIDGIWFFTASGELEEDPDQVILSVKVYDYSIE